MSQVPIKWFHHTMTGAPSISGEAGKLIQVLDACLINGFNLRSASISVSNGIATLSFGTAHGYLQHQVILVQNAPHAALDGEKIVLSVTTNSLTFSAQGVQDIQQTSGVEVKTAPVGGWEKRFSSGNIAVYRSTAFGSTGFHLQVDDTTTTYATLNGFVDMTSHNSGTENFASFYLIKSNVSSAATRPWSLFADNALFYISNAWMNDPAYAICCFGDIVTYKPADAYHCLLAGFTSTSNQYTGSNNPFTTINNSAGKRLARAHNANVGAVAVTFHGSAIQTLALGSGGLANPNPVSAGIEMSWPVHIVEPGLALRGHLPGIIQLLHNTAPEHGTVIGDIAGHPGKKMMVVSGAYVNVVAPFAIDISGPWR